MPRTIRFSARPRVQTWGVATPRRTKSSTALGLLAGFCVAIAAVQACGTSDPDRCSEARCAPGNRCLPAHGETRCRRPCAASADCPAGSTCVSASQPAQIPTACQPAPQGVFCDRYAERGGPRLAPYVCEVDSPKGCIAGTEPGQWCCDDRPGETYAQPFCMRDLNGVEPGPKQFGAPCNASGGRENNPDCDTSQGFACFGTQPGDGGAYCTRYGCHSDRECSAEMYCATINEAPNAVTAARSFRSSVTVCLKRDYCAPCSADRDCPSLAGVTQYCVSDQKGALFCAPECSETSNCNNEAVCVDSGFGPRVCYPRAGVCVGDGTLCSPCRADADCGADGVCVKGTYSSERACAKPSPGPCSASNAGACATPVASGAKVICTQGSSEVPAQYCAGVYRLGAGFDLGCFTPPR